MAHSDPSASGQANTGAAALALANPDFELGARGWSFTPEGGSGTGTENPHTGSLHGYLSAGEGARISQCVTAAVPGSYDISAWIAAGGPNGHFRVRVNDSAARSVTVPQRPFYARHTISRIELGAGDRLEVAFTSGDGRLDIDDVMLSPSAPADPLITSSDPTIVDIFNWAKHKANSWVHLPGTTGPLNVDERNPRGTGSACYGPCYWAGYAHRSGYYARDFAHQVAGAQILGLNAENKAMLRSFAVSATSRHGYYPVWSYNFDLRTYLRIDYNDPNSFVREVPAPFELVEKANQAHRWSGDPFWVQDQGMWDFYLHTTGAFVEQHDSLRPNGVAEGTGEGIFSGSASYNEQGTEPLAEAGDAIACQYRAHRAVAQLAEGRGATADAIRCTAEADQLRAYFNSAWSGSGSGASMIRAYSTDGTALTGWGRENSWFMPMKRILHPGERNDAYLAYIDQQAAAPGTRPANIEALTYLPDTFFANHRNDAAWRWMRDIYDQRDERHVNTRQGLNGDYPEVSFTLLSQTVEGLLGLRPDAPGHAVSTLSGLPSGMAWLQVAGIPVGAGTLTLRHDGATASTLTSRQPHTYAWQALFAGVFSTLTVNGVPRPARRTAVHGLTCSYVTVTVAPGRSATVEARVP
ncbi:hypothetical protein [Streptomyces sp. NPDC018045]|uniref:hypothetical protein n=1 Tax=Streptomyces sp. NPDC018045 TaxID=3365037 RepID=UPI00378E8DA8